MTVLNLLTSLLFAFILFSPSQAKISKPNTSVEWISLKSKISLNEATKINDAIVSSTSYYNVNPNVIRSMILKESTYKIKINGCSKKDPCVGLMQIKPQLHAWRGRYKHLSIYDPKRNVEIGTHLLSEKLKECGGNYICALQKYNTSQGKEMYARRILAITKQIPSS